MKANRGCGQTLQQSAQFVTKNNLAHTNPHHGMLLIWKKQYFDINICSSFAFGFAYFALFIHLTRACSCVCCYFVFHMAFHLGLLFLFSQRDLFYIDCVSVCLGDWTEFPLSPRPPCWVLPQPQHYELIPGNVTENSESHLLLTGVEFATRWEWFLLIYPPLQAAILHGRQRDSDKVFNKDYTITYQEQSFRGWTQTFLALVKSQRFPLDYWKKQQWVAGSGFNINCRNLAV